MNKVNLSMKRARPSMNYNGIANVFQSFYGKDSENKEERGINSYQLVYFKNRWWIANLLWTGDANGVKIPKKYLRR